VFSGLAPAGAQVTVTAETRDGHYAQRATVAAGDGLVGTVTTAADSPESIRGIRNFILLSKFFASIPPNVLKSLLDTVSAGANREKAHKAPSLLTLLWRLRNEDGRHAASVVIDLFEGLGKGL
jgi:hypothetical protein